MKLAFYKKNELEQILTKIFQNEASNINCQVSCSEELDMDTIEVYENDSLLKVIDIEEAYDQIEKHIGEKFTHHDVIEVGDFGEGFAFFIPKKTSKAA
ncbi:putative enzyme involved in methoxymalonyl-ACP biosynthesis [Paenibacillus sp. 1182]|uniref:hypothetical protein n=1 Tax=Paenibacillus sp. 1182 TaxID=2806565 RepID=UPI001AE90A9D|nr:hypothetical protein [Paenibacillus sp. 1182]MBP1309140.1 putative enzyme involved in methoxymalonyl-ACP biosynthesis [Paenibacillus sp. 1182]